MINPITLLVVRVLNPLAEFKVVLEGAKVTVPAPTCINWQLNPTGNVAGTVTVTAETELIKNNLLLSAAVKVKPADLDSMTKPPEI
jgi:hypothetical protein